MFASTYYTLIMFVLHERSPLLGQFRMKQSYHTVLVCAQAYELYEIAHGSTVKYEDVPQLSYCMVDRYYKCSAYRQFSTIERVFKRNTPRNLCFPCFSLATGLINVTPTSSTILRNERGPSSSPPFIGDKTTIHGQSEPFVVS